ncbi:translocation/assembly module TamB domain-containing protein [uncultured Thiocystis sp.]|jgi:translocation and assembly module TamB|uniref:translocation/assembly module TamB domain-containing protein n=1 Tax=uncultured Thiocystis sp. TaxID=1202134 RepID=UPI0025DA11E6|nr:translocation/assembly module TamB domain-containing protein [uncultured Thiocystis sp.]
MLRAISRQLLVALLLPLALAGLVLLAANTHAGQRLIVWAIEQASDGRILIEGLSGTLPGAPRLARLDWRDADGAWLRVEDAAIDLDLWGLTRRELVIDTLTARAVYLTRLPRSDGTDSQPLSLPLSVRLRRLTLDCFDLDAALLGLPLTFSVAGNAVALAPGGAETGGAVDAEAMLELTAPDGTGRYQLTGQAVNGQSRLHLRLSESPDGQLARLANRAGLGALTALGGMTVDGTLAGTREALTLDAALAVGSLVLNATGSLHPTLGAATQLTLAASAPALTLSPESLPGLETPLAWRRAALTADLHGPWRALQGSAQIRFEGLTSSDLKVDRLTASAFGETRRLRLDALVEGLKTPVDLPPGIAADPLRLAGELAYDDPDWPFLLRLRHPLLDLDALGLARQLSEAIEWTMTLPNLAALVPGWSGQVRAQGRLTGGLSVPVLTAVLTTTDMAVQMAPTLDGTADLGRGRLTGQLHARLSDPWGALDLTGDWAGQPVSIAISAGRTANEGLRLSLGDSRWGSVAISGDLELPLGAAQPQGALRLNAARLADLVPLLQPWTGTSLAGRLDASLILPPASAAEIAAKGTDLLLPGAVRMQTLDLDGRVTDGRLADPGKAKIRARLHLEGLSWEGPNGVSNGVLTATAQGSALNPALTLNTALTTPAGRIVLKASGRFDLPARRLAFQHLDARVQDESIRLLAPAVLDLRAGIAVDRLRLGLRKGSIEITGRATPKLNLRAKIAALPLEFLSLAVPESPLTGILSGEAQLAGAPDAPLGSLRLQTKGLRLNTLAGRSLPPADIKADIDLEPTGTRLAIQAEAGADNRLSLRGRLAGRRPLVPEALDLRATGQLNLNLLDPLLTGRGRQASGRVTLDTAIAGSPTDPRLNGTLQLAEAAFWDRTLGLALTGIAGTLRLSGDTLRVERLAGTAGSGSIALSGSLGLLAPGVPMDLTLVARAARPIQSDLLDAQGDADLTLRGNLADGPKLVGAVRLSRVEIRLPERLPANIATLRVRERGAPITAPEPPSGLSGAAAIGLDLTISAHRAVTVRGRGIDAELGGAARLGGTVAAPLVSGGFDLLRGQYELVGQNLRFNRGRIEFDGAAGFDPSLDLESRTSTDGGTAILSVLGRASAPRIVLRGEPDMPDGEILSRLLFGVAGGRLSALQAARLGIATASLAGIAVDGPGLLERARARLGLHRLMLGTDEQGRTTLEGGRQVSDGVYLGVRQNARAGEPQGVLRIEITPNLRLEADVGATGGTRAGAAYEIEY